MFGVEKYPLRRSFYTWAEGAAPIAVFEFLSDSTARQDRDRKIDLYLNDIGVQEYFIHQPQLKRPAEFRGWQRSSSGKIVEMEPDAEDGLFSEALNLWFRGKDDHTTHVRLLRPYLLDGTPITTSMEEEHLRLQEKHLREEAQHLQKIAETIAKEETERSQQAETIAAEETKRRQELENELEKLCTQITHGQKETT